MIKRIVLFIALVLVGAGGYVLWNNHGLISGVLPLVRPSPQLSIGDPLPFQLPAGFTAHVYADEVPGARVLKYDPRGTLVVSLTSEGTVVALPDENSDGKSDEQVIILENLDKPHGIVFHCTGDNQQCNLFVAEEGVVKSYDYDAGTRVATNPRSILALPTDGGHSTRTLMLHPDGAHLLVSVGSLCNACNEKNPQRATILSVHLATLAVETFATGLRNTVFMAIHPGTGDVWGTEMGRDLLGDDIPPDEINIVKEGVHYGWPVCYGKNIHDTKFDPDARAARRSGGSVESPCSAFQPSHIDIPAHSAPLGLAFMGEGWPEDFRNDLLVAYHGSWNRSIPTGYKIVRMVLDDTGALERVEDFMTGFTTADGEIIGRPAGILVQPGVVYVSDDRAGAVYKITRE